VLLLGAGCYVLVLVAACGHRFTEATTEISRSPYRLGADRTQQWAPARSIQHQHWAL